LEEFPFVFWIQKNLILSFGLVFLILFVFFSVEILDKIDWTKVDRAWFERAVAGCKAQGINLYNPFAQKHDDEEDESDVEDIGDIDPVEDEHEFLTALFRHMSPSPLSVKKAKWDEELRIKLDEMRARPEEHSSDDHFGAHPGKTS